MRMPDLSHSVSADPLRVGPQYPARSPAGDLQMKPASPLTTAAAEAPAIIHDAIGSPGQQLDTATRAFFEPRFGHDLGAVRVHTDAVAAASAQAVGALAYTVGHDLVFAEGQYKPYSRAGRRLLSHELAHLWHQGVQQVPYSHSILRRQPAAITTADPQPSKVKQLVQQSDPTPTKELWQLIANNALDNKPTSARGTG